MYAKVRFSKEAHDEYVQLQTNNGRSHPTNTQLLKSINRTIDLLSENPYLWEYIPKKYITKKLFEQYDTNKIFRVEIVGYWRLLYTLIGKETHIIAFILEFMDHKSYDKKFNYRKR